jgi:hypothetical protein
VLAVKIKYHHSSACKIFLIWLKVFGNSAAGLVLDGICYIKSVHFSFESINFAWEMIKNLGPTVDLLDLRGFLNTVFDQDWQ